MNTDNGRMEYFRAIDRLKQPAGPGGSVVDEGVGGDFDLQTPDAGADVDMGELKAGLVNEGREVLFHADWRAAAPDVTGDGKQFFHGD